VFTAYIVVTVITILVNVIIVIADLARAKFVLANSAEVGLPASWLPRLAILKAAGAAGLLLGLLGVQTIGVAAAIGLTAFFVCAIGAHLRARVFYNIAFPGTYLALALGSLTLAITQ
jgi:hypothetical protein